MRAYILGVALLLATAAQAQLDNTAFYRTYRDTLPLHQLSLQTDVLGYFKSNEYMNRIVEGYTLPGYQLWPSLHYRAQEHLTVEAGLWLQKDFGSPGLRRVEPTLSLRLHDQHRRFIFGTLEGTVEHGLLEPLMDFERVLEQRLENGTQLVLDYPRAHLDVWSDWMQYIFPADSMQEEFAGGIHGWYDLLQTDKVRVRAPGTVMFFHRGGQIDAVPDLVFTLTHFNAGLEGSWYYPGQFIHQLDVSAHYIYFFEWNNAVNPYPNGNGWYANMAVSGHKFGTVMLSYWKGYQFLTGFGGRLYRSQSSDWDRLDYTEQERELFILRVMSEFDIGDNYRIMLRTEPHYDVGNNRWEYAFATYVHFDPYFVLGKVKQP